MKKQNSLNSSVMQKLPLMLTGIGSETSISSEVSNLIVFVNSGSGVAIAGQEEYKISTGCGLFVSASIAKNCTFKFEDNSDIRWISIGGTLAKETFNSLGLTRITEFEISGLSGLPSIWNKINKGVGAVKKLTAQAESCLIYSFVLELNRMIYCPAASNQEILEEQLKPVFDFMNENYSKEITLEQLSKTVDLSPQYICRIFKKCTNMRPFEFITRKRIEEAKKLVLKAEMPINEISKAVGYSDCSYFCAVFKKQVGMSPISFRNHTKANLK